MTLVITVKYNMYVPHHFLVATHDTQSIGITSTSEEVCVMYRFFTNTKAVGCEIQYYFVLNILKYVKYISIKYN